jgi:hypothetical protein
MADGEKKGFELQSCKHPPKLCILSFLVNAVFFFFFLVHVHQKQRIHNSQISRLATLGKIGKVRILEIAVGKEL